MSDELFMTLPVKIFVSPRLGETGDEIIKMFDSLIDAGEFDNYGSTYQYVHKSISYTRQLRASSVVTSTSSSASDISSQSCTEHDNEDQLQYTEMQLFLPLVITFLSTTIGIICYFVSRWRQDKALKSYPLKAERVQLIKSLSKLTPNEIINGLKEAKVDSSQIREGMNMLPKVNFLIDLLVSVKSSHHYQDFESLMELDLYELHEIAYTFDIDFSVALNDRIEPREKLIELILANNEAKDAALEICKNENGNTKDMSDFPTFAS